MLLGSLQEPTTSTGSQWLSNWQKGADIFNKVVTALAFAIGGGWAYFRFRKERTYESNLELAVSGEAVRKDGAIYLSITANAKNIGSSQIGVFHPFTAFRVLGCRAEADAEGAKAAEWTELDNWRLLEDQNLFEPGEPIVDTHLILVHGGEDWVALKLEVYVCASTPEANGLIEKLRAGGLEGLEEEEAKKLDNLDSWVATSIVNLVSERNNNSPDSENGRA